MHKITLLAGCALACVALSGCSTLGGIPGSAAAGVGSFNSTLDHLNTLVAQNCGGDIHFNYSPPLPPNINGNLACARSPAAPEPNPAPAPAKP